MPLIAIRENRTLAAAVLGTAAQILVSEHAALTSPEIFLEMQVLGI